MTSRLLIGMIVVAIVTVMVAWKASTVLGKDIVHDPTVKQEKAPASVLDFKVKDIDGKDVNLADYKGKVVLIVNVASKCGYTPQYTGLEKLYEQKKDQGFVTIGFPANNFKGQEPGTDLQIKEFCTG